MEIKLNAYLFYVICHSYSLVPKGNKVHPPKNHIELPDYESARSQELQGITTTVFVFRLAFEGICCDFFFLFVQLNFDVLWVRIQVPHGSI